MIEIMTPDEYIGKNFHLYAMYREMSTFKETKLDILDQILNVIGNGIRDNDEFLACMKKTDSVFPSIEEIKKSYEKPEHDEKIFTGYTHVKIYGGNIDGFEVVDYIPEDKEALYIPHRDTAIKDVRESEKSNFPEVICWKEKKNKPRSWIPYPNFQTEYSTVYFLDFDLLGKLKEEWIKEFIWFYEEALAFLESEKSLLLQEAFPSGDARRDHNYIENFKGFIEKYETNEEISKAYNQEYTGDIEDFLTKRWDARKAKWIAFIKDTIKRLNQELK